ncbi:Glucose/ribitol dehydrogenase [Penicillium italicum]|uniref:3beta-hydroxysteroid 3-dehydrogenase n=1 Tax=Penicillium italicum TaxID=40296 RepID=A0A0A2L6E7_PENIT|nr:Glucose/ribitol dehydrogenase [Penicillium italicum]
MPFFQPRMTPSPLNFKLTGQTVVVTGPTAGLGFETCRQLMGLECHTIILACRDISKGFRTRSTLLSDFDGVLSFTSQVTSDIPVVDILILNAGIGFVGDFRSTPDGHEVTLQTNYLSNVLLVLELLPYLQQSIKGHQPARITWLGSRSAYDSNLVRKIPPGSDIFRYLDNPTNYSTKDRYADTKLLCLAFLYSLSEHLDSQTHPWGDGDDDNAATIGAGLNNRAAAAGDKAIVLVNMVCPGLINTDFTYKYIPFWAKVLVLLLLFLVARTVRQGVWIIMHAAGIAGEESRGQFLLIKNVTT